MIQKAISILTALAILLAAFGATAETAPVEKKTFPFYFERSGEEPVDTVADKNLYCLVSPVSFSCGNLVPWVFKASGTVTLLGDTSGGGSCVVRTMSSAWGSLFSMSGTKRISFVKNGSFYDVDRGVDPDVFLTKKESFYDREQLTEFINSLR